MSILLQSLAFGRLGGVGFDANLTGLFFIAITELAWDAKKILIFLVLGTLLNAFSSPRDWRALSKVSFCASLCKILRDSGPLDGKCRNNKGQLIRTRRGEPAASAAQSASRQAMDPAINLQQRIAQGLSISLRNSLNSLGLGNGVANNSIPTPTGSSETNHTDGLVIDVEKGRPELEHQSPSGIIAGSHVTASSAKSARSMAGDSTDDVVRQRQTEEEQTQDAVEAEQIRLAAAQRTAPLTLATLPPELQMLIIRQLNFGDIERLRRTCRFYRKLASPRAIRVLFGPDHLRRLLLSHCARCLAYDEERLSLLQAPVTHPDFPLCALCVDCAVAERDDRIVVGRKVTMGNGDGVWICRWCGWPVTVSPATGHVQFHRRCYNKYNDALLFFFSLGWMQLALGVIGAALAWRYFRNDIQVFAPTVTSFLLLWVCFLILTFRGNRIRTYHWSFLFELMTLLCWIPPIHWIIDLYVETPYYELPRSTMACLIFFCFNLLFRLLNVLGNLVLLCEYQRTSHHLPSHMIPWWRHITNPVVDCLIFWTYPQCAEQKYPPHWS
ncbi:hypothetical protein OOU_Y34scaffold00062g15 [Pyricularia oryzae Y34]|uniref:F-box domain-containing protein n=2 Tax=Pyricularia oryzae TaxID=318829 RepID=A0AA97PA02_PYRO3|nr:hypothetical protein OOU_Y34scaffold00062g15 [Pyricularia oryzae Y34]